MDRLRRDQHAVGQDVPHRTARSRTRPSVLHLPRLPHQHVGDLQACDESHADRASPFRHCPTEADVSYRSAAAGVAVIGGAAGYAYGRSLGIPNAQLTPMLAAFLVEAVLYLGCGFETVRRAGPKWVLAASAPLSYLIYTLPLGLTSLPTVAILLVLGAAVAWWFDVIPERAAPDLLLMVLLTK